MLIGSAYLSTLRKCTLLSVSRSSVYYRRRGPSQEDLALIKQIDQQYQLTPFYGSRRMMVWLGRQGCRVSQPAPGHKIHRYLLRGMEITKPNQVWAAEATGHSLN